MTASFRSGFDSVWERFPWLPSYAACAFFAVMAVCVKLLTRTVPLGTIMFYRSALPILIFVPSLFWRRPASAKRLGIGDSLKKHGVSLFGRGACGAMSLFCYLVAMKSIPASEVVLTTNTSPLFATLAAWIFLGEKMSSRTPWSFAFSFAGILLVVNGGVHGEASGYLAGIGSAALAGIAYSFIRRAREVPPELIALAFTGTAALCSVPWAVGDHVALSWLEFQLVMLMGLTGGVAQWLMTVGYQYNSVAVASTLGLAQVACTTVLAGFWLGESFSGAQVIGVVLILGGTYSLTRLKEKPGPLPPKPGL